MTIPWDNIHTSPIQGETAGYRRTAGEYGEMAVDVRTVLRDVKKIGAEVCSGGLMRGQAADALGSLIDELDSMLAQVPGIASDIEGTFRNHERQLLGLQQAADTALARAKTNWQDVQTCEARASQSKQHLAAIRVQIDHLHRHGTPEQVESDMPWRENEERNAHYAVTQAESQLDNARFAYKRSTNELGALRAREDSLIDQTARALDDQELGDLADPSNLEKLSTWIGDFAAEIVHDASGFLDDIWVDLTKAAKAALSGDFATALWALRDAIDKLEWVILAVAIVAAAVAVVATGGAALPALLALYAKAGVLLATTKAVAGGVLWKTGWAHPDTGDTVSGGEFAFDLANAAMAIAGAKSASAAAGNAPGWSAKGTGVYAKKAKALRDMGYTAKQTAGNANGKIRLVWPNLTKPDNAIDYLPKMFKAGDYLHDKRSQTSGDRLQAHLDGFRQATDRSPAPGHAVLCSVGGE